jgi:hypothetical protein
MNKPMITSAIALIFAFSLANIATAQSALTTTNNNSVSTPAIAATAPSLILWNPNNGYQSGTAVVSLVRSGNADRTLHLQAYQTGRFSESNFFFNRTTNVSGLKIESIKLPNGLAVSLRSSKLVRDNSDNTLIALELRFTTDQKWNNGSYPVEITMQNTQDGTRFSFSMLAALF